MSDEFEITRRYFSSHFADEQYSKVIHEIRSNIQRSLDSKSQWQQISQWIEDRKFEASEPLKIVHNGANQVLDENSDSEAYKWLDLFVKNVERSDAIEEY